jgi:hypothetical protein
MELSREDATRPLRGTDVKAETPSVARSSLFRMEFFRLESGSHSTPPNG